jgi:hypothetical protein
VVKALSARIVRPEAAGEAGRMRWWKLLGLAGVAGVTAAGVLVARAERHRRAYRPEEIRVRLHARLAEAADTAGTSGTSEAAKTAGTGRAAGS